MLRDAVSVVAVFTVTVAAIAVPYIIRPGVSLEFSEDAPNGLPYTRGVYAPEREQDGLTVAWVSGDGLVTLDALPRSTEWTLYIRGRAARPGEKAYVKLLDGDRQIANWNTAPPASRSFAEIFVNLRPGPTPGLRLQIVSANVLVPGPHDPRVLGVLVDRISLRPVDHLRALPWRRVLLASGVIAALYMLLWPLTGRLELIVGTSLSAIVLGLLLHKSSMLYLPAFSNVMWGVVPVVVVLAAGLGFRRLMGAPSTADVAFAITSWFTYVKYLLLTHPAIVLGDAIFHQNRARVVAGGEYLFTSAAPGGEFPYPVAFYVVANLLSGDGPLPVQFMRGFVLTCDSLAGLLLAFSLASPALRAAAPLAAAFWQTTPALYQAQAIAYLTNSFGNSLGVMAVVFFKTALDKRRAAGWLALSIACVSVAFLAHVSTFVILAAILACTCAVALLKRRRRTAALCAVVLVSSLAGAWTIYYRHFTPLYAQKAAALRPAPVADDAPLPVQRLEAHQTMFVPGWPALKQRLMIVPFYLQKYLGVPLLALASLVVWTRRRSDGTRIDGAVMAVGWLIAVTGCFIAGQLTSIDVRYYLGAAPLVAALAALAAATILAMPHKLMRGVAAVLSVAAILQGCHYMARFLEFPLPR